MSVDRNSPLFAADWTNGIVSRRVCSRSSVSKYWAKSGAAQAADEWGRALDVRVRRRCAGYMKYADNGHTGDSCQQWWSVRTYRRLNTTPNSAGEVQLPKNLFNSSKMLTFRNALSQFHQYASSKLQQVTRCWANFADYRVGVGTCSDSVKLTRQACSRLLSNQLTVTWSVNMFCVRTEGKGSSNFSLIRPLVVNVPGLQASQPARHLPPAIPYHVETHLSLLPHHPHPSQTQTAKARMNATQ